MIDGPPSARDHVWLLVYWIRHWFNISADKIDWVEKRGNTAPIPGRLLETEGRSDMRKTRFDGEENGLSYGASLAAAHAPCAKWRHLSLENDRFRTTSRIWAAARRLFNM